ncbi:PHB depolymerase family esterase [Schumannella sp. 10F1B-5-1]|uniref:alpha/beta hydrolase family esterase n=1 Tax=Schumannella sp. 10F1B-5-1 TaxID=2590780 RepID=UPI001132194A|nr:hypothetical protein [Schumannella sp. 10F1B-5-1]TPW76838.1 hypothetical protein FJ658_02570 [Schumannella sp. 10F1B-5-1]
MPESSTPRTASDDHVDAAGRRRTFTVVAPGASSSHLPGRALVLVFHGSKQTAAAHRAFTGRALDTLAADGTAVVAYLDGHRGNWNDARRASSLPARLENIDDVAFARAVIERLVSTHGIDPHRVIAVGYSNGGQMVMRLLHETGGPARSTPALTTPTIAGAIVIAATMPDADGFLGDFSDAPGHRIPVAVVAGTADRIVPFGGGRMARWARTVFRVDGTALSAPETAAYFARRNGITASPVERTVNAPAPRRRRRDRAPMRRADFRADGRAPVTLFTVDGGGHTVPGPKRAPALLGRTGRAIGVAEIVREVLGSVDAVLSR